MHQISSRPYRVLARRLTVAAFAASVALTTAACGADNETGNASAGGGQSSDVNQEAAKLLPESIRSAGVVKVASTINYPPEQFYDTDGKTPIGMSVDLGTALGKQLGVEFDFENVSFDAILPGITAGRYDVAITSMSINPDRAKQVNFVKYFDAGATLLVAGDNSTINSLDDLCGKKVANAKGSFNGDYVLEHSKKYCEPNGKKPITLDEFAGESPYQAVAAGRVDAAFRDFTANAYAAQQSNGKLKVVGDLVKTKPYGIAVAKDEPELADAINVAMSSLIKDGQYKEILNKWDVAGGAIDDAELVKES